MDIRKQWFCILHIGRNHIPCTRVRILCPEISLNHNCNVFWSWLTLVSLWIKCIIYQYIANADLCQKHLTQSHIPLRQTTKSEYVWMFTAMTRIDIFDFWPYLTLYAFYIYTLPATTGWASSSVDNAAANDINQNTWALS